jgi:YbbR domain-containing protein
MKNRNVKFISSFFAALMLFVSCSQYDSDLSTSSVDLKSIHQTVKTDWSDMKESDNSDFEIDVDSYQKEFDLNFRYGQENGLDEMFRKNGFHEKK